MSRTAWLLATVLLVAAAGCAGPSAEIRAGRLGAEQEGMATYYSPRLAGHHTANGERYDPARFTAAHPAIPFGTHVEVTRTDGSQRTAIVRVNDRCSGKKKIIDVSEAAARQLDMLRAGIVPVRIRVVAEAPSPAAPRAPASPHFEGRDGR
jgi:rare lipoprotein A